MNDYGWNRFPKNTYAFTPGNASSRVLIAGEVFDTEITDTGLEAVGPIKNHINTAKVVYKLARSGVGGQLFARRV